MAERKFRIWDSRNKVELRWRYYSIERHAQDHALIMVRWSPVNATLEVIDASIGKHLGTYMRRLHDIVFYPPDNIKRRPYGEEAQAQQGKHRENARNQATQPGGRGNGGNQNTAKRGAPPARTHKKGLNGDGPAILGRSPRRKGGPGSRAHSIH